MSEDSDDARYSDTPLNTSMGPSESIPTSPSSPHRHPRPLNGTTASYPSLNCNLTAVACSQPRQRGSDSEGRFPSSPSDICHSADLRRAALMRSVQMRVQPPAPPSYDVPFSPEQETLQNMEAEDQPCSCRKSLVVDCTCQNHHHSPNLFAQECASSKVSESDLSREKPRRVLDVDVKEESCEEAFSRNDYQRQDLLSSGRSILTGKTESHVDSNLSRDRKVSSGCGWVVDRIGGIKFNTTSGAADSFEIPLPHSNGVCSVPCAAAEACCLHLESISSGAS